MDHKDNSMHKRSHEQVAMARKRIKIDDSKNGNAQHIVNQNPSSAINCVPDYIDYKILAIAYPELEKYLIVKPNSRATIRFSDPSAVRTLNESILLKYFNLSVKFPLDNLCPPVPNRFRYIQWIDSIVKCLDEEYWGMDIGTGATCIYPLLGVRAMPRCKFIGTDISEDSISYARKLVKNNCLEHRILLYHNTDPSIKLPVDEIGFPINSNNKRRIEFCMCNPPFYMDEYERDTLTRQKIAPPSLNTIGRDNEMYTTGGEVDFIKGLINESVKHKYRIRWFTSMMGKKSTLAKVKEELKKHKPEITIDGKFTQGTTTRYLIAWSFYGREYLKLNICISAEAACKWWLSTAETYGFNVETKPLKDSSVTEYKCSAIKNTWSRKARRQAKLQAQHGYQYNLDSKDSCLSDPILEFKVRIRELDADSLEKDTNSILEFYLNQGSSSEFFESFYNHISRSVMNPETGLG